MESFANLIQSHKELVVLFPVIFLGGFLFLIYLINSIRAKRIKNYCDNKGWKYLDLSKKLPNCNKNFKIIDYFNLKEYSLVMVGKDNDINFSIMDFRGTRVTEGTEFGSVTLKSRDNVEINTIYLLSKKGVNFPKFYISTGSSFGKLADAMHSLAGSSIEETANPLHLSDFRILGDDMEAVSKLFSDDVKALLRPLESKDWKIESTDEYLFFMNFGVLSIDDRIKMLEVFSKIYKAMISAQQANNQ